MVAYDFSGMGDSGAREEYPDQVRLQELMDVAWQSPYNPFPRFLLKSGAIEEFDAGATAPPFVLDVARFEAWVAAMRTDLSSQQCIQCQLPTPCRNSEDVSSILRLSGKI